MAQVADTSEPTKLAVEAHVAYIQSLDKRQDELDYWLTEHLRLNGLYWGLTALHLLGHPEALPRQDVIDFVLSCQHENGGFGAAPGHDAHMLSTVSAVQILAMTDAFDQLDAAGKGNGKSRVADFIANLQTSTGTFAGDEWGEEDTRFLYGAFNALSLLGSLSLVDVDAAVAHIAACANFDGGFGVRPGAESHSGQIFTCVAALTIAKRLDVINQEKLARWLSERQVSGGGLNGRPEKQEDVCYSWWVLSSLAMIDKTHWIDRDALIGFILGCQDVEKGGFSDRPGDMVDVWHTLFGLTGLSLLKYPGLEMVDPVSPAGKAADWQSSRTAKHCQLEVLSGQLFRLVCRHSLFKHNPVFLPSVNIIDAEPSIGSFGQRAFYTTPPTGRSSVIDSLTAQPDSGEALCLFATPVYRSRSVASASRRGIRDWTQSTTVQGMASGIPAGNANKQIPLLCTVCPDTPRFSDVSHLLTHIASKGHLHHETQTKLKAHQDIAAAVALQQYEQWYRHNGIETLLVERMRAKQVKEAARNKRTRGLPAAGPAKVAPPPPPLFINYFVVNQRLADEEKGETKHEQHLFQSDNETEPPEEFLVNNDMLSLKGQVWPGMGKMDLANEEMKRTRNQRKHKSVIERMRRTSEGIEPTQVIMTSEFEVERVKGVYDDSSSPIPGQEDSTPPRKVPKTKRKKPEPLAEISTNIPRQRRSTARGSRSQGGKVPLPKLGYSHEDDSGIMVSQGPFRHHHDVFRDDDGNSNVFDNRSFPGVSQHDQRFDLRDRLGMPALNPMSQPPFVSPTPTSRDLSSRLFTGREGSRGRVQVQSYLSPFNHLEASYAMNDATIYNASSRMPFAATNQFSGISQDQFRLSPSNSLRTKQEGHIDANSGDSVHVAGGNQFLNISGANPLFSHDHLFLSPYSQAAPNASLPSLAFTPINRPREHAHDAHGISRASSNGENVKVEGEPSDSIDGSDLCDRKDTDYSSADLWNSQTHNHGMNLHDELESEDLQL
ncbi:hypothetical protein G7046_g4 [Stylonectria norvegica]|nr:hypothetical protein G7046_g4 [Stylonectria norvegica]